MSSLLTVPHSSSYYSDSSSSWFHQNHHDNQNINPDNSFPNVDAFVDDPELELNFDSNILSNKVHSILNKRKKLKLNNEQKTPILGFRNPFNNNASNNSNNISNSNNHNHDTHFLYDSAFNLSSSQFIIDDNNYLFNLDAPTAPPLLDSDLYFHYNLNYENDYFNDLLDDDHNCTDENNHSNESYSLPSSPSHSRSSVTPPPQISANSNNNNNNNNANRSRKRSENLNNTSNSNQNISPSKRSKRSNSSSNDPLNNEYSNSTHMDELYYNYPPVIEDDRTKSTFIAVAANTPRIAELQSVSVPQAIPARPITVARIVNSPRPCKNTQQSRILSDNNNNDNNNNDDISISSSSSSSPPQPVTSTAPALIPPTRPRSSAPSRTCTACQKLFSDSNALRKHLKTHATPVFNCTHSGCNKVFKDNSKLKRHQLVHTREKPFECSICNKNFSLEFNLKAHLRIHTKEKPFQCIEIKCGKFFSQISNLKTHYKQHNNEKNAEGKKNNLTQEQKESIKMQLKLYNEKQNPLFTLNNTINLKRINLFMLNKELNVN